MARPRKDEPGKAPYHTKAKAWLVCSACDVFIPYAGNSDPSKGDGWPLHRCASNHGKPTAFTRYTNENPAPPIVRDWDSFDIPPPKPEVIIG